MVPQFAKPLVVTWLNRRSCALTGQGSDSVEFVCPFHPLVLFSVFIRHVPASTGTMLIICAEVHHRLFLIGNEIDDWQAISLTHEKHEFKQMTPSESSLK